MTFKHPFSWTPAPYTVFKNPELKQQIETNGYAVVDLFDSDTIERMRELYHSEHSIKEEEGGMFYSVYSLDIDYRKRVHSSLKEILDPTFDHLFTDFNNGLNFFINKLPGSESSFSIHQDSSAIDEMKHSSLSIWIPLQDVDESNGALWAVEKTHVMFSPYRSVSFSPPFSNIQDTVKDYLKPIPLKAGQALVFDSRIIHTSGKNLSGEDRIAVVAGILPKEASFQLSYQDKPEDPIEIYSQDDDFLINYPNFFHDCVLRPTIGEKIGEAPFVYPKITAEEFEQNCSELEIEKVKLYDEIEPNQHFITEPVSAEPPQKASFHPFDPNRHEEIRLFKDDELEKQLCEEGYVIIPFFNEEEVESMLNFFQNQNKEDAERIFAASHSTDVDEKTRVNKWVANMYTRRVEELFVDTQILGGTFVAKPSNGRGHISPHRDWNLVDETRFRSCNIWVPLVDTNEENGAIQILPKSHLIEPTYRGPNIRNQLLDIEEYMWDVLEIKPMKAGQAFIYDHRFIHGSKDNMSDKVRPASACAITHKDAEFRFYHSHSTPNGEMIEEFDSYPDYLLREDRFDYPTTIPHLRTIPAETYYDESHFDGMHLVPRIKQVEVVEQPSFLSRLKSLIKRS